MATELTKRLGAASSFADLDQADLASLLDVSPRTVTRWLHRETTPGRGPRERLLEVIAVLERLSEVLRPEAAHDWLFSPNPQLDYRKPMELLRYGQYRQVIGAIDAMA